MINLNNLTNEKQTITESLAKRGYQFEAEKLELMIQEIKQIKLEIEKMNALANNHQAVDKNVLKALKAQLIEKELQLKGITDLIPNLIHGTVPLGKGAQDNPVIKEVYIEHLDVQDYCKTAPQIGIDIEAGVNLAGARFMTLRGQAALLHRKLINTALDFYGQRQYEEFYVPNMVNKEIIYGTAQYPKFKEEIFTTTNDNHELFLVPTGEVPLTNLVRNKILMLHEAENKMMTHTPCFRKEVGAAGKDTRGIIRQHQFEKVELVRTCLPENGLVNFQQMIEDVEAFVAQLGIRYRIIELCAGDIGFAGHKAYDFELWFAHAKEWREIASVTWCTDFQARRMNTKVKREKTKEFIHTLNGTGLAAGRVLAAILENHTHEGKIDYPDFLK